MDLEIFLNLKLVILLIRIQMIVQLKIMKEWTLRAQEDIFQDKSKKKRGQKI